MPIYLAGCLCKSHTRKERFSMKRANGTGTIVKLSGNRRRPCAVRIPSRDRFGRVCQVPLGYYATNREALAALDEYNRLSAAGRAPEADKLSMTVQQVYDAWSAREYKRLKPPSVTSHKAAWNKRVSRYGDRKMRDVSLDEWQQILDEDEEAGLSQSSINNDALLIKALYAYSMERDIVGKDYSRYLDIPSVDAKRMKGAFNDLQMHKLEQMAAAGVPWADTALMLCYTGFRITEFLTLTRSSYHPEEGGYLQGGIKTDAGRDRIIPVHPKIAPYLARRLEDGGGTIITREGESVSSNWYRATAFPPIAETLGAPEATPHWCRHTFATMLHAAKADPMTVKWLMGHSTKRDITAHYTHETLNVLRTEILKLA